MRLEMLNADNLKKYGEQLSEFERAFTYPLGAGQKFRIDHGARYASFFEDIGDPTFALLFDDDTLAGVLVAMKKKIKLGTWEIPAIYYGDLKVHPIYQGRGLSRKLFGAFVRHWSVRPSGWISCHYGISMQDQDRDTFLKLQSQWLIRRFALWSRQRVFFISPEQLANLPIDNVDEGDAIKRLLNLSPTRSGSVVSTHGKKDLIIEGQNQTLSFVHFSEHAAVGRRYLEALTKAGVEAKSEFAQMCFAIDDRRTALLTYLEKNAITASAAATVYGLPSLLSLFQPTALCLCTSEI